YGRPDRELILKIGIHSGAAIAVTLNERLDYFGQTVNIAARVQSEAGADEIWLSPDIYDAGGVRGLVAPLDAEAKMSTLKGVEGQLRLFCVPPSSESSVRLRSCSMRLVTAPAVADRFHANERPGCNLDDVCRR